MIVISRIAKDFNQFYKEEKAKMNKTVNPEQDLSVCVSTDLLRCAATRNNILTEAYYEKDGMYSLDEVRQYYGSFSEACIKFHIINPDNIEDCDMVIANIKSIYETERKMTEEIYRDYGAYDFDAINKRYGFRNLLFKAGIIVSAYPVYRINKNPLPCYIVHTHTYEKRFFGF